MLRVIEYFAKSLKVNGHSNCYRSKYAVDCMKNANKSPKIHYFAMVRQVESDPENVSAM